MEAPMCQQLTLPDQGYRSADLRAGRDLLAAEAGHAGSGLWCQHGPRGASTPGTPWSPMPVASALDRTTASQPPHPWGDRRASSGCRCSTAGDAVSWATEEMAQAALGDRRLNR